MSIRPIEPIKFDIYPEKIASEQPKESPKFEDFLKAAIYDVDDARKYSEELNRNYMAGTLENMHDLTIAQAQSEFKFQAMVEVNNKLIETYKELARIQI